MRIDWVHLTNYRCHADLKVAFEPGFNVIVGVNGSGKTSLLNAVCDALTGYAQFVPGAQGHTALADSVARLKMEGDQGRFRFEPQFPVEVGASGEAIGVSGAWKIRRTNQIDRPRHVDWQVPNNWQQALSALGSTEYDKQLALPVLAFYRADRRWHDARTSEMAAATMRNARTDGYKSWWNASLDATALQAWVIGKCLERLQVTSETGAGFQEIQTDELALVNQALATAVEGAKGLKYDFNQKSLLVEWQGTSNLCPEPSVFENLSDGQRSVIGLVADIARRMCLLNPQLGQDVTRKTPGVVLIDELDIHLHPRWQRIVTGALKRAFPAVQFIVASHSPQVLGELQPNEIILLRPGGTSHPQVSYGLTSSQVLEEVMEADARAPAVQTLTNELFDALERGQLTTAKSKLDDLRVTAPGIPELAGAEALLRRKEVLGR